MCPYGTPKSIFKIHVTVAIFLYYALTFTVTVLKVKTLGYRWMEGGGFVRVQAGKGGRHRFRILNFGIVDQSHRDPLDKSGSG